MVFHMAHLKFFIHTPYTGEITTMSLKQLSDTTLCISLLTECRGKSQQP